VKVLAVMCLLACTAGSAAGADEGELDLTARQRIFPAVGPGLRAVKRGADGRLYILASPSPGLLVFDAQATGSVDQRPRGFNKRGGKGGADNCLWGRLRCGRGGPHLCRRTEARTPFHLHARSELFRKISVKNPLSVAALPKERLRWRRSANRTW